VTSELKNEKRKMKNEFRLLLFLVGLIFISWAGYTQTSGCTDPNALNFDPDAYMSQHPLILKYL